MIIENIAVSKSGYINCRSCFYTALSTVNNNNSYSFSRGINYLYGDIDSSGWAVSYYLSMFGVKPEDFTLQDSSDIYVNGSLMPIEDFLQYSCYMDNTIYPLFNGEQSVKELITQGIESNKLSLSPNEVKELFRLDSDRFERPVSGVGNERFRAMAQ